MLLLGPLALGFVHVLEILIGEVALVDGREVIGGLDFLVFQNGCENSGARQIVNVFCGPVLYVD